MKLSEFKNARKEFRGTQDSELTAKILKIIKEANLKGNMISTRQISNLYYGKSKDSMELTTTFQDSILQSVLNPMRSNKKLIACYGERNSLFWKFPDEVLARMKKQNVSDSKKP